MEISDIKMGIGAYVGITIIVAIFFMILFKDDVHTYIIQSTGEEVIAQSQAATQETTSLLLSLDKITLDTSILNSSYLQSLTPFPTFPVDSQAISNFGKANPFIGNFFVVPTAATSSVGGLIYSNQRSTNNGNSLVPVSPTRR